MSAFDLEPDPLDHHAYYDRMGNRYIFHSHKEYKIARDAQIIAWLAKGITPYFL